MNAQGWLSRVLLAAQRHEAGDTSALYLVVARLMEVEKIKERLLEAGIARADQSWAESIDEMITDYELREMSAKREWPPGL